MRFDRRGDMGFLEAMVAMMVVITALLIYMGAASALVSVHTDQLSDFDEGALDARVAEGKVIITCSDYMREYLTISGAAGISLTVSVPAGFSDGPATESYGSTEGDRRTLSSVSAVHADHGRVVVAVFEVTVWYRTGTE